MEYKVSSTSSSSATINDIELNRTKTTRKILRPTIINNSKDKNACVKFDIIHQRIKNGVFEDIPAKKLSEYQSNEIGKLSLDSQQVLSLFKHLCNLFDIYESHGIPFGQNSFTYQDDYLLSNISHDNIAFVKKIIKAGHSQEVWDELLDNSPDLVTKLSYAHIHHRRLQSLLMFKTMLSCDHSEADWQLFFENNTWIFGYGLNYQILKDVAVQPNYGGKQVDGKGENRGDFLKSTQGSIKYTVLVEIKRPDTDVLQNKMYRNDVILPSLDLIGGVSQLRANARTWELDASPLDKNRDQLERELIFTVQPKKILVIGNMKELDDNRTKHVNFEQFRKGQLDVEILTFDEVYERAKYIVEFNN